MDLKPIPSFYCCYLLRSKVRNTALYVGSTPNPKRRLDQHNGLAKGGAHRTAFRGGVWRPWEMSLIVTGFPSNVAALQFEWAWQNSHLTRKISKDQRISIAHSVSKWSRKQGKYLTRTARLPVTLKDKLGNLHLLLRVPSFARWPLQIRFFREDVYESWLKTAKDIGEPVGDDIAIVRDFEDHIAGDYHTSNNQPRVSALDVSFEPLKSRLEKSLLLKNISNLTCSCCPKSVDMKSETILVCPKERCYSVSHSACLSEAFLGPNSEELIPVAGDCPKCKSELSWIDLVHEASLRTRDEKMVNRLMKPKRRRGGRAAENQVQEEIGVMTDEEQLNVEDVLDEPSLHDVEEWNGSLTSNGIDVEGDEEEADDMEEEDQEGLENNKTQEDHHSRADHNRNLPIMIEDSDDSDDWHILD